MSKADEIYAVMKGWIGEEETPPPCEVEKAMMMKLPWVVGDPNPLWRDEDYASGTPYGGLVASPYFVEYLRFRYYSTYGRTNTPAPRQRLPGRPANVVGGQEVEYFRPIRPGDVIHITCKTTDLQKRWSKKLDREVVIETFEQ
ncbi:MAG: MaoC family dehydratase, partial [Myxococcota bacterium]